jgi:TDG/mug DNA glycosylase family protein
LSAAAPITEDYSFRTLPDYLTPGLDLILIGINPGIYSVERGHYFGRSSSRFWPGFSASKLSEPMRRVLRTDSLLPLHDAELPRFGIGLTDIVKRPSANVAELSNADFEEWSPRLLDKVRRYAPSVACFHGITGYRKFLRFGLQINNRQPVLGRQPEIIGATRVFVVPNPSPANAHFTLREQIQWYDRVAEFVGYDKLERHLP